MSDERSPEELLQSALSSAFTQVSVGSTPADSSSSAAAQSSSAVEVSGVPEAASAPLISQKELEKHEQERAALEQSWKEQSAIQRREAEERRAKIAAERTASGQTWEKLAEEDRDRVKGPPNPIFNPKNVGGEKKGYPGEPSVADARDVVTGEPSAPRHAEASAQVSPRTTATLDHSQRWEEIESIESSYPSLSFPEHSDSAPSSEHGPQTSRRIPTKHETSKVKPTSEKPSVSAQGAPEPLPSATLSIFDSRLSTRNRLIALFSSLSINLLLPFINGVMLGFGEIFARNMASRFFGWQIPGEAPKSKTPGPGGAATAVGVRAVDSGNAKRNNRREEL